MTTDQANTDSASYDEDDGVTTAIDEELTSPTPATRIDALAEQQAANRSQPQELISAVQRARTVFEQDGEALAALVSTEIADLDAKWDEYPPFDIFAIDSSLRHVFGPDRDGTGAPKFYRDRWADTGGSSGAGIGASANNRTGKFWASHYTISSWRTSQAGLGSRLTPQLPICRLSVRPYVRWEGFDGLYHSVHHPGTGEVRQAIGRAELGIVVQSRVGSGNWITDGKHRVTIWDRNELNPNGSRSYDGTGIPSTGLQFEVVATNQRQYVIWITCKASVWADPGFAVSTRASASVSCDMPYVVVEEIPM